MGTIEQRLRLLRTLIWVGMALAALLTIVILTSQWLILDKLPASPDASLIGLLQTIQTGLVGALMTLVGAIGTGIGTYFTFRSAKETSGEETPSGP